LWFDVEQASVGPQCPGVPVDLDAPDVFTHSGRGIEQMSTWPWYKALKHAGIADFRWHDLRRTWARWAARNGKGLA